ncbi:hypothetical protein ACFVGY_05165 [Streptomyces sp. NPDC127106]|uniref:hypothetical protein n=1 Tax=Streptomyces sp. NPDC127106 TaxID=3345360 RepID=UPI00363A8397
MTATHRPRPGPRTGFPQLASPLVAAFPPGAGPDTGRTDRTDPGDRADRSGHAAAGGRT